MTESASATEILAWRVVVAMNASTASLPALDAAVEIAAALGGRLEGLFVEDLDLVHLAGLPFAGEVSALTGGWRSFAPVEIERALRVEAARLKRLLAQAAERARLPWTFAIARGRLLAEAVARRADLTVIGSFGSIGVTAGSPTSRGRTPTGSVAILFDGSPGAIRALVVAARLAKATGGELSVLVPQDDLSSQTALCEGAQSRLAAERLVGAVHPLAPTEGAFVKALRACHSAMLVFPVPEFPAEIQGLIADLWCPLIIVR